MSINAERKKTLIIGCGIAGAAVAILLKRIGFEPVIYEAETGPDDYAGLFLNLARNGLRVMRELNLDRPIRENGIEMQVMNMYSGKGKLLGTVGQPTGDPQGYTVKRGFLHRVLREEVLSQGIPIEYGKKLKHIETRGEEVAVLFEDGTTAAGHWLIGCDGIHSKTRNLVFPDAPTPSYTGLLSYGGFVSGERIQRNPGVQTMIFGKKAFFGYLVKEDGEVYWFGNMNYPGMPTRREMLAIPQRKWRDTITKLHADDLPPVPTIVRATKDEIGVFPIYDIRTQPKWHTDRIVLIGDAIHATSPSAGQGASLALEDAIVLAKCMRDVEGVERAFATFESLRKPRVERIVQYARSIGQRKNATNPVQVFFRDMLLPMFLKSANKHSHDWMYDYTVTWDEPVSRMSN